jgi:hypothetical protein
MKIWIYWSKSNTWINFFIVLNKNWKIYWSEQSLTGLGSEDRTKFDWSWVRGQNKVWLVLGRRTEQSLAGLGSEDRTKFDWSWVRGPVLIVRTILVLSIHGCVHMFCTVLIFSVEIHFSAHKTTALNCLVHVA